MNWKLGKEKYKYTVQVIAIIQNDFCVTFVTKNGGWGGPNPKPIMFGLKFSL